MAPTTGKKKQKNNNKTEKRMNSAGKTKADNSTERKRIKNGSILTTHGLYKEETGRVLQGSGEGFLFVVCSYWFPLSMVGAAVRY